MNYTTVAHYKVLHELGRGGMGIVCKAHDLRLGRDVALKFLPPSMTSNARSRERLISEARAVSQLDHPNVCTVYEIEETEDGQVVIVMAFYEGETLADRLQHGPIEITKALHITQSMLQGLGHAHARGVVHRDIKPSNVILCGDDGVKIVDFGLARFMLQEETATQDVAGTLAYLEPETVAGQTADHHTDLWSCGVVLYEMLCGAMPFDGDNVLALMTAIARNEPRPLQQIRPGLPPRIYEIVSRALAKYRGARYASAGEFLVDLQRFLAGFPVAASITAPAAVQEGGEKSLVVLPFTAVGGNSESDCFSDGLTDEIITDLSGIHRIRVICRTSAMRLKGTEKNAKVIAAELGVRYVLAGTVRISGQQLRVNAQLVDPASDLTLWAEKFNGSLEDVFSIQEEVSRRIVAALKVKLTPGESLRLGERPIEDIRAYEYYLRARQELLSYSRQALERALEYIAKGERIIGENVLLLSARGYVHWQFVNAGVDPDPEHIKIACGCATRIQELDPNSPHGFRLQGLLSVQEGKTQQAVHQLKRSLELAPNDPDSMAWMCALCSLSGKGHAVTTMAERLVEIDPLTPTYKFMPGFVALLSGDLESALPPFEQALAGDPGNQMLRCCYGQVLLMNGRFDESIAVFERLAAENPGDFFTQLGLVLRHGLAHEIEKLRAVLTEEIRNAANSDLNYSWLVAQGWALAGETEEALHWLRSAVDHGFINYPLLNRFDPTLWALRRDPGFIALMEIVRQRWEVFEV